MVTRFDRAYEIQVHQLRLRIVNYSMRYWNSMGSWRDGDIDRLIAAIAPKVQSGQQRISDLTDARLSRVAGDLGFAVKGRPFQATTQNLRGISDETLYTRPFVEMRTTLASGGSVGSAIAAGKNRLRSLVETNLQLAKTHAARRAMSSSGVEAFERVLTGRENCALCVIASTQRYWVKDLQPIHPGCDCYSRPYRGDPNEHVIHADRLDAIHSAVENEFGTTDRGARYLDGHNTVSDYLDLITVQEHGEIGPVLSWRGQRFTSASDIGAA